MMRNLILVFLCCVISFGYSQKDKSSEIIIPEIIYSPNQDFVELYNKAWELALDHIKYEEGMPQSPYIDEAFWDNTIWIWDTEFMMLFYKYAQTPFSAIKSLNNFYQPIHDGKEMPLRIEILDNPPFFAWTEYEYFKFSNDKNHLEELLYTNQYLQKHFHWFDTVSRGTKMVRSVPTNIEKEENGYRWEGGSSGMDNTPRGRRGANAIGHRPNNPDMLWIDAIAQQGLAALYIANLYEDLQDSKNAQLWKSKYQGIKFKVNQLYWDEEDGFYYDINRTDLSFMKVRTPASYWPMLAEMCSKEQAEKMAEHVKNADWFGGKVPWTTLARNDADFDTLGGYWRGSMWLPTAYMGIKALEKYEFYDLARNNAIDIINHMLLTYQNYEPHTIWECYNPNHPLPATTVHGEMVRPDFCGWSALGPISLLIENVIGIYEVDAAQRIIKWNLTKEGKQGVKDFCFGDIKVDMVYQKDKVEVKTNQPFTLEINGIRYEIKKGVNTIEI